MFHPRLGAGVTVDGGYPAEVGENRLYSLLDFQSPSWPKGRTVKKRTAAELGENHLYSFLNFPMPVAE